jgi:hypothetical protein
VAETAADILIDRLIGWGIHEIFGLPGDGINGIMEVLRKRQDDIRCSIASLYNPSTPFRPTLKTMKTATGGLPTLGRQQSHGGRYLEREKSRLA